MELFQLSKAAKNDLRAITSFTEHRWGKTQRNLYLKQLDDAFVLLAQNPAAGFACGYIREGYRKFPHASHIIFYKCALSAEVLIVRVLHKNMDYNLESSP